MTDDPIPPAAARSEAMDLSDWSAPEFALLYGGTGLHFDHLQSRDLICTTLARPGGVRIRVSFSCHCFTETYLQDRHKDRPFLIDGGRKRAFCPTRFEMSRQLPELIDSLPAAQVYLTPESNFMRLGAGDTTEYRMYFSLKRLSRGPYDLKLYVQSAYPLERPGLALTKMQKVRFKVLADKILNQERLGFHRR